MTAEQPTPDNAPAPDDETYGPLPRIPVDLKGQRVPYDAHIEDVPITGRYL